MGEHLTLGEDADAPGRRVWEDFAPLFLERIVGRLEHEAKEWMKCGHVDPRNARLLAWLAQDCGYVFLSVLHGTSSKQVELRQSLRDALVIAGEYDRAAPQIHKLAAAVRRREVYNVVRRASTLLEAIGASDEAALLMEYADRHEPAGDGVSFSRIRRRKNEPRRTA